MIDQLLNAKDLAKSFEDGASTRAVLRRISVSLKAGETLALCGPSGSGKSTLLNLLAGVIAPDAGEVWLTLPDGSMNLASLSEKQRSAVRRRHMGYVFQFFNLVPTLTVRENVLLPLELAGREALAEEALSRLSSLGLDTRLNDFPETLSGGERQRTAIARALAHRPLLVLADEPTGNLDAERSEGVVSELWKAVREQRCALVVATHSEAVAQRADRVLRLDAPPSEGA